MYPKTSRSRATFSTVAGSGNATAGSDYVAKSEVVHFNAGETAKQVLVTVNGDTTFENNETFSVQLSNATNGATISDGQGTGTIVNDDANHVPVATIGDHSLQAGGTDLPPRPGNAEGLRRRAQQRQVRPVGQCMKS